MAFAKAKRIATMDAYRNSICAACSLTIRESIRLYFVRGGFPIIVPLLNFFRFESHHSDVTARS